MWELDGLKPGPINLGKCTEDEWLDKVIPVIQQRIARYEQSEIKFNLMALIHDRKEIYTEEIKRLTEKKENIIKKYNEGVSRKLVLSLLS